MKKALFGILTLLLISFPAYSLEGRSAIVKLGVLTGEIDTDSSVGNEDLEVNLGIGVEYFFRFESGLDLGIGAAYEKQELKEADFTLGFDELEVFPVYGLVRYRLNTRGKWTPYIYGNLGYAFTDENKGALTVDGGIYYGAGIGVEYKEVFGLEAGWAGTEFDAEHSGTSFDPKSDLIKLNLTMRLDH